MIKKIKIVIPFLILFVLCLMLWREMIYSRPNELPSVLIGEDVPAFSLPVLDNPLQNFTPANFRGQFALVNVWATWCYACSVEHDFLMKLKDQYHVPIYSINYKDNPQAAKEWLNKHGNPYVMTGTDLDGNTAIDFGVYGTPETFVISPQGKIIYRQVGVLDQKAWDQNIYPLMQKYGKPE